MAGAGYPDRPEMGHGGEVTGRTQIRHLQRRRGRPRRVHGSQRAGERSPSRDGRDGHRRVMRSAQPKGFVYVRAEYPLAVSRLQDRDPPGQGSSACSARTSSNRPLISTSISASARAHLSAARKPRSWPPSKDKRGQPRPRPPFPAESGLWGFPTLINNVETFANIVADHHRGAEWYASHRHGKEQGHEGLRPHRQDPEQRPDRSADGHHHPRDRRGTRRRRAGRHQESKRCRPAALPAAAFRRGVRHAGGLRIADEGRLDHGLGRHGRHG